VALAFVCGFTSTAAAKGDGFSDVVKAIEQHYRVKHRSIPLLARAGMKAATTAARLAGGSKRRLAELGSLKVAYFEDQDFSSASGSSSLKPALYRALGATWSPLIQVASPKEGTHVYIFLRDAGEKFNVLVITIEPRDATVVQLNLSPATLAKLIQDPEEMGNAINAEATTDEE
jgi:hypothetical protein